MISYQTTSMVIAALLALVIIWLSRRDHLHALRAFWWLLFALAIAVVGMFPGIVNWLAAGLGIHYTPILALVLGLAVVVIKLLTLDIARSREQQQTRILAQKISMLEARLNSMSDGREGASDNQE